MTKFKNSHMNGQCVDVTLTDLNGNEVPMPSEFDDFTEKARLDCKETTGEARKKMQNFCAISWPLPVSLRIPVNGGIFTIEM